MDIAETGGREDVTERRTLPSDAPPGEAVPPAGEFIQQQVENLEPLLAVVPTAVVIIDEEARVAAWNPAAEKLFGYAASEALGHNVDDLVCRTLDLHGEGVAYSRQALEEGYVHAITRRSRKDGSLVDVELVGAPLVADGRQVGTFAIYHDITELQRQKHYYESLLEISPTAIVTIDREAQVTSWNPAAERLFGYTSEQAIGRNIDDLLCASEELRAEGGRYNRQVLEEGSLHAITHRSRKDGSLVDVELLGVPLVVGDVEVGAYAIYHDISELQAARREAEAANRLKTDFFTNVSHEFRTPITLTLGPLEQVLAGRYGVVPESVKETLLVVQRNQERLLGLINQILEVARVEGGRVKLRAAPIRALNSFVEKRVDRFRPMVDARGIDIRMILDPALDDADLYLDAERFDLVVSNLLANALKFTERGSVEVSTLVEGGAVVLSVADTGIGIREEELPHVFDRFRQADGSESRTYPGTGIGLSLVKEITELHGGTVAVESRPGEGSTFRVTLPLGKDHLDPEWVATSPDAGPVPAPMAAWGELVETGQGDVDRLNRETERSLDPAKPVVLYAEDNADLRNHVRNVLAEDCTVFLAADGRDALEKAARYRPDLIIADQMMPAMSGRDLLRAVRSDRDLRSTPVIFLTAVPGTDARIESLDAGADEYLTKPFHEGELRARVRNLLRARAQEQELAQLARRLEARVEEQMAELVRTGELRRFLPHPVAQSLLSGDLEPGEGFERRKVTVLFADLVGFTDLADVLEPEELTQTLNRYLKEMSAIAAAHGGTLDNYIGDGLMVVFGAPQRAAEGEQAWSAVRTAVAMRDRMGELAAFTRRQGIPADLRVRIGVNTGHCTLGIFGSDFLRAYKVVGFPVNVAQRLQTEAEPDTILCGFRTWALVRDRVVATEREPLTIKGGSRPVEAYEIRKLRPSDTL